jgi:hypothetical protein
MADTPMTVVETARFLKDIKRLMPDSERDELVLFVGANPESGEIIPDIGKSYQGRAQRDEAVGADAGGGVFGEEIGGHK